MDIQLSETVEHFWVWAAFFSLIGFSWMSQRIKQYRNYPLFLCKIKQSKDGKHQYKKIKAKWIRAFNYGGSAIVIGWCLSQTYDNIQQVLMVTFIVEMLSAVVLEMGLKIIAVRYPDAAEVLREGLYVDEPDEDLTVFDKTKIALAHVAFGGGKGIRHKEPPPSVDEDTPTRVLTPEEIAEFSSKYDPDPRPE